MTTFRRLAAVLVALLLSVSIAGAASGADEVVPDPVEPQTWRAPDAPTDGSMEPREPGQVSGPGVRPADRKFKQQRRSCKAKAVKQVRVVRIVHVVDGHDDQLWWAARVYSDSWHKVKTPRGCVLRHREWVRHHGGRR